MITLNPLKRRVVYVAVFETLAILFSTLLLQAMNHGDAASSLPVAIAVSVIAVIWNFIFNSGFEAMERRAGFTSRGLKLRVAHSMGFEGGLILFTVPLLMLWYQIGLVEAFVMEAALLVFFLFYTFVFTLIFDQIFTLPGRREA